MSGFVNNTSPRTCIRTVKSINNLFNKNPTSLVNVVTRAKIQNLLYLCYKGYDSERKDEFSKPVVAMGMYIAVASLFCVGGLVADLLSGMWNERYHIPSKYSSLNTASMMVITVAMKLTVDMTGSMPSNLDQMAKIGSIAFMCTTLAILNPSLASMNNKTLRSNIIGLVILVITITVNLCLEIHYGVITNLGPEHHISTDNGIWKPVKIGYSSQYVLIACIYIGIMLLLLLISISTAIIVPSIKKILEFKYQEKRKALNDQQQLPPPTRIPTVEQVTQHVARYWVMAQSGSPQFVMACNLLSYTSLVLCVAGMIAYVPVLSTLRKTNAFDGNFESDYKWSILVIFLIQLFGSFIIGTGIIILRCYTSMKFKVHDILRTKYSIKRFIVRKDKYWTQWLRDWQGHSHLGFLSSHPRSRAFIHHIKKVVLSLCIGLQFVFVQLNQLLATPFIYILSYIIKFEDASGCRFFTTPVVSKFDDNYDDLRGYFLQLEDDEVQPSKRVVEAISASMNRLIQRAKKKQNNNLLELLGKSNGFKGVENFDDIHQDFGFDERLLSVKLNSWSVPVVTLSCIAIAVPGISKVQVDSLIKSIDEALLYTCHVEESFNSAREYVNIRKTALTLWYEVRERKWLGNSIKKGVFGQLPRDILTSLAAKAKEVILKEYNTSIIEEHMIDFPNKLIAAYSMHRISNSILMSKYQDVIKTEERFFELLCSMIADILVACFSNLPQVIKKKCHADEIEKREASVEAAVKLLGRTTEIIRKLEACEVPSMDPEKMGSIDEWRLHLKQSSFP